MNIFITAINTALIASLSLATAAFGADRAAPLIVNHLNTVLADIPRDAIQGAIDNLVIAYGHTSHGSQLVTGMDSLAAFIGDDIYSWSMDGAGGTLELRDYAWPYDLGYESWEPDTRAYLDIHPEVNVVIWSWCSQVSYASEAYIDNYLALMDGLETDYPDVVFVYMTGHLNQTGEDGNLHLRNEQIRDWCRDQNCVLYDFADIESYDPDGIYYLPLDANDNCDYDSDANGTLDRNWAIDWQNAHPGEWYTCYSAHSQPLNANLKAYAAWWLWARLAGWSGIPAVTGDESAGPRPSLELSCYPNPFNPTTTITFSLPSTAHTRIEIYDTAGKLGRTLVDKVLAEGSHQVLWDGKDESGGRFNSGVYFYRIAAGGVATSRKMVLLR